MSGHNKWSTIKHKKAATDAKRGKVFTKLIKELTIAARQGGSDPTGNPRLRTAIATAKAASMPANNIERAVKKGAGELDGGSMEEGTYEGYGPSGVAILMEVVTDNRNRTTADVRHCLSKNNGNLGENGCVAWMFDRRGIIVLAGEELDEDEVMEAGLEADGFEDIENVDGTLTVYTDPTKLYAVNDELEKGGYTAEEVKIGYIPQNMVKMEGKKAEQMMRLMDMLEENEDVTNIYTNADIDDEEFERIANK